MKVFNEEYACCKENQLGLKNTEDMYKTERTHPRTQTRHRDSGGKCLKCSCEAVRLCIRNLLSVATFYWSDKLNKKASVSCQMSVSVGQMVFLMYVIGLFKTLLFVLAH